MDYSELNSIFLKLTYLKDNIGVVLNIDIKGEKNNQFYNN